MAQASERSGRRSLGFDFSPLPAAVLAGAARGAIDAIDVLILANLWWRAVGSRTVKASRDQIVEWTCWRGNWDTLYRRLSRLADRGFLTYTTTRGMHGARYVFTLDPEPDLVRARSDEEPGFRSDERETVDGSAKRLARPEADRRSDDGGPPHPAVGPMRAASGPMSESVASPLPERDPGQRETGSGPMTSEAQKTCLPEEKYDHHLGEGTRDPEPLNVTDRMLAALAEADSGKSKVIEAAERARAASERRFGPGVETVPSSGKSGETSRPELEANR